MTTESIPSIEKLNACTEAQLEEAALILMMTIKAANALEPSRTMTTEELLLADIRWVLAEKALNK